MTETFESALQGRVGEMLDACTRCGKCVEVCPATGPAGLGTEAREHPASVIGGIGNNAGALLGGPIVGLISAFAAYKLGGEFESLVLVLVLVAMLLIRPQGIFGATSARRV